MANSYGSCVICAEEYDMPIINVDGSCSSCNGSPRDCDCGDVCPKCGEDLKIMGEDE